VLFPGLIFRRLYFYGEFSKEFKAGYSLISLLAISTIPGLIILIVTFWTYDSLFIKIDLGEIIDILKDINSPSFRLSNSNQTPINELINSKAAPFIFYLYIASTILGSLSGRLVRITRLDTKFKLLRFKNYWFYLLNGQHSDLKKLKHLKEENKKHLFTKADILIDLNSKTHLYSGIVVDYELDNNDCNSLSKIMLQNAKRYNLKDGKRAAVDIPGTLFVVDCSQMRNINLTYIFQDTKSILKSKTPNNFEVILGLLILLLIPIFIFQAESIELEIYKSYFELRWYLQILSFLIVTQFIGLLNPFVKRNDEYSIISFKGLLGKIGWILFMLIIFWLLN
tara:strand:- start:308 stop:1321 length:1014 start_codon:yes stop_codon:yes gene_type:complete